MLREIPDKEFLEEKPLYTKFHCEIPDNLHNISKVNINMYCENCKDIRNFSLKSDYRDVKYLLTGDSFDLSWRKIRELTDTKNAKVLLLIYLCASCEKFHRYFLIKIDENLKYLQKIGQFPSYKRPTSKEIKNYLGDYLDYYEKGLMLEYHGYGIGAYAYYRRIIEGIIDDLLERIKSLMTEDEKKKYEEPLNLAKKQKIAKKKIEIVKDLIPELLIQETLIILHEALSIGLHAESDERIMDNAQILRRTLIYFIEEIFRHVAKSKEHKENIDKIKKKLEEYKKNQ